MSFFGQNIRFLRNRAQLSQTAFAELFNLKRAAVGAYEEERAEPKVEVFVMIARHFGVPVEDLICKNMQQTEAGEPTFGGISGIPYLGADSNATLLLSYDSISAQLPKISLPLPGVAKNPIALQHAGSLLIVSEIDQNTAESLPPSKVLGVWSDGNAIIASTCRRDYAKAFQIHYILKEYSGDSYAEIMMGEISRRLEKLER